MELKYPELRSELVEELELIEGMACDLKGYAEHRPEWHDDEDDCLMAAHRIALQIAPLLINVRDILDEMP